MPKIIVDWKTITDFVTDAFVGVGVPREDAEICADVLIEEWLAKQDEKIEKEVEKARKRFGEKFDEQQYRTTSPRVVELAARRDEIHRLLFDVRERFSQTVVIVTHDEGLAGMADRKIVMSDGRIL